MDESLNPASYEKTRNSSCMVDKMAEDKMELTVEKADRDYDAQYKTGNVMMRPMHCEFRDLSYKFIFIFISICSSNYIT